MYFSSCIMLISTLSDQPIKGNADIYESLMDGSGVTKSKSFDAEGHKPDSLHPGNA